MSRFICRSIFSKRFSILLSLNSIVKLSVVPIVCDVDFWRENVSVFVLVSVLVLTSLDPVDHPSLVPVVTPKFSNICIPMLNPEFLPWVCPSERPVALDIPFEIELEILSVIPSVKVVPSLCPCELVFLEKGKSAEYSSSKPFIRYSISLSLIGEAIISQIYSLPRMVSINFSNPWMYSPCLELRSEGRIFTYAMFFVACSYSSSLNILLIWLVLTAFILLPGKFPRNESCNTSLAVAALLICEARIPK